MWRVLGWPAGSQHREQVASLIAKQTSSWFSSCLEFPTQQTQHIQGLCLRTVQPSNDKGVNKQGQVMFYQAG